MPKKKASMLSKTRRQSPDAFRRAMREQQDLDSLRANVPVAQGLWKNTGMAKRATAVLRMFKPDQLGVVDWRAAAMMNQLELSNWNVDEAVAKPPRDKEPWDTYIEINDQLAVELNKTYRSKRRASLPRTADVEMAIFGLSFKVEGWNRTT